MTWGNLFLLLTWHNLYTNEKLFLCRLKYVKGYLLSYQYFYFVSSESSTILFSRNRNPDLTLKWIFFRNFMLQNKVCFIMRCFIYISFTYCEGWNSHYSIIWALSEKKQGDQNDFTAQKSQETYNTGHFSYENYK